MNFRQFRRFHHFFKSGVRPAIADVFQHRSGEQEHILLHDANRAAQVRQLEGADVLPVQQNRALAHLIEARDQLAQRGLAAARGADQRQHLARRDVQIHVFQHAAALFIGEGHVFKADVAHHVFKGLGVRRVHDIRLFAHHFLKAVEARHAGVELLHKLRQPPDGALDGGHIQVEGDELCQRQLAIHDQKAAKQQHQQAHGVQQQFHAAVEHGHGAVKALFRALEALVPVAKFADLIALIGERLGHAHAGNARFDIGVDPRHALLHLAAAIRHALALGNGKEQQNGHHDQHHQRQLPLHAKQHDERANQRDHGNEQVFRAVVRELRNFKQIVRHARHQPARAVAVVKREGQALQLRKNIAPHIRLHINAHHVPKIRDDPLHSTAQKIRRAHRDDDQEKRAVHLLGQIGFQHGTRHDGEHQIHQRHHQRAQHIQQKQPHMRLVIPRKRAQIASCALYAFIHVGCFSPFPSCLAR